LLALCGGMELSVTVAVNVNRPVDRRRSKQDARWIENNPVGSDPAVNCQFSGASPPVAASATLLAAPLTNVGRAAATTDSGPTLSIT
jgi:hypothetical protein